MPTHIITTSIKLDDGRTFSGQQSLTAGKQISLSESIPGETDSVSLPVAVAVAKLKSIFIHSEGTMDVNFNGPSGLTVVELEPGEIFAWDVQNGIDEPFGANITSITVDNNGTDAATITIEILVDPT